MDHMCNEKTIHSLIIKVELDIEAIHWAIKGQICFSDTFFSAYVIFED